ncbi:MAG: hypothetical protein F6J86_36500 [Symploca sp. SIO1B1]|nr:hypothetical protein [Symploca sp. SIO1B1]
MARLYMVLVFFVYSCIFVALILVEADWCCLGGNVDVRKPTEAKEAIDNSAGDRITARYD